MKYTLCENVYIVNGAARSCIYDFNNNRLFSINASLAKELSRIKISGIDTELIDAELRKAVNEMANMGILRESEEIWNRDISEITRGDHSLRFAWIEITVVNGRFCPQSVRSFCPIVAGFNAGTYKVPACVL